jgi:hypothetical protein
LQCHRLAGSSRPGDQSVPNELRSSNFSLANHGIAADIHTVWPFSLFAVVILVALVLYFSSGRKSLARVWPAGSNADHWYRHLAVCDFGRR